MTKQNALSRSDLNTPCRASARTLQRPRARLRAPRHRRAPAGHSAIPPTLIVAQIACGTEPPPRCSGFSATSMPATAPATRITGTNVSGGRRQRLSIARALVCGHHFRLSQWTLAADGAVARVMLGTSVERTAELALL
jgi:hypothetical protein